MTLTSTLHPEDAEVVRFEVHVWCCLASRPCPCPIIPLSHASRYTFGPSGQAMPALIQTQQPSPYYTLSLMLRGKTTAPFRRCCVPDAPTSHTHPPIPTLTSIPTHQPTGRRGQVCAGTAEPSVVVGFLHPARGPHQDPRVRGGRRAAARPGAVEAIAAAGHAAQQPSGKQQPVPPLPRRAGAPSQLDTDRPHHDRRQVRWLYLSVYLLFTMPFWNFPL